MIGGSEKYGFAVAITYKRRSAVTKFFFSFSCNLKSLLNGIPHGEYQSWPPLLGMP